MTSPLMSPAFSKMLPGWISLITTPSGLPVEPAVTCGVTRACVRRLARSEGAPGGGWGGRPCALGAASGAGPGAGPGMPAGGMRPVPLAAISFFFRTWSLSPTRRTTALRRIFRIVAPATLSPTL